LCQVPSVSSLLQGENKEKANCQLPTANCQSPTANCQLPIGNCQLLAKNIEVKKI